MRINKIDNRIDVFEYIERACDVLEGNLGGFTHAAEKLTEYLQNTFGDMDCTIGVTSRIKTRDSLKEKVLRNNLYKEYPAGTLVFNMHDIIGVRIECRFFKDEAALYKRICEVFCCDLGGGIFCPNGKKAIRLKLDTPQPEKQRNGFSIYRIDGEITYANESYNFELQLKSLVNSFWSEIEHKLIYKNSHYNPADTLIKEILNSIHDNLTGVDHQLSIIFDRFADSAVVGQQAQLEQMLAIGLNEVYSAIVQSKTGITVSIKDYSEAVVIYLLNASSYARMVSDTALSNHIKQAVDMPTNADAKNYSGLLVSLMEWMRLVDYNSIAIGERIQIEYTDHDPVCKKIAELFMSAMNNDFYLNTFFHIYFSIERGSDNQDFADYIRYYKNRITYGKSPEQIQKTLSSLEQTPVHKLPVEKTIKRLEETL